MHIGSLPAQNIETGASQIDGILWRFTLEYNASRNEVIYRLYSMSAERPELIFCRGLSFAEFFLFCLTVLVAPCLPGCTVMLANNLPNHEQANPVRFSAYVDAFSRAPGRCDEGSL